MKRVSKKKQARGAKNRAFKDVLSCEKKSPKETGKQPGKKKNKEEGEKKAWPQESSN